MIGSSKLTQEDVDRINAMIEAEMDDSSIAEIFGVTREHINHIRHGRRWNIEKNSFVMKHQMGGDTKTSPKNFAIVRINKKSFCLHSYEIPADKVHLYKNNIESVTENQTGGWTINIRLHVNED